MEFKQFSKIENVGKIYMSITQKIHGTNAQVYIYKDDDGEMQIKAGSRTRFLDEENDNYSFAKFVLSNKEEFIEKLGEGRHYGEWCGPGINSGEGLEERNLVLFDWRRYWSAYSKQELPDKVRVVPVIYKGKMSMDAIDESMDKLKNNGSYLVPGYMKTEGIVIEICGNLYKKVFDNEETKWQETTKKIYNKEEFDVSYLLQPIRLNKLLSRDEAYIREYPNSLKLICSDYVKDLEDEKQFRGIDEDSIKKEKKYLGKEVYSFVKSIIHSNEIE